LAKALTKHIGSQKVAVFRGQFVRIALLKVIGLRNDEKLVDQSALEVGEHSQINAHFHQRE